VTPALVPPAAPAGRCPTDDESRLFAAAGRAADRAYAPYSGYAVGAALVAESGGVHLGVNVENASYPAGMCAERAALAAAVTAGERRPRAVAVAAGTGADCLPCGVCLQALAEFGDLDVVARADGAVRVFRLAELLTAPFSAGGAAWGAGPGAATGDRRPAQGTFEREEETT
jgi:cytidine deaminase